MISRRWSAGLLSTAAAADQISMAVGTVNDGQTCFCEWMHSCDAYIQKFLREDELADFTRTADHPSIVDV